MEPTLANNNDTGESFLDDVFDTGQYDKKVKSAQTTIYIVAALQLIGGIIAAFMGKEELMMYEIGIAAFVSAIFFGLGLWCKSKPFTAIITALCLYGGLWIIDIVADGKSVFSGLILKIIIIVFLSKGIGAAKAAADLKKMAGK